MKKQYKKILARAIPYLRRGRRWDLRHTRDIIVIALRIVPQTRLNADILIPAVILHDIGWSQVPRPMQHGYRAKKARLLHMQRGALLATKILQQVQYPAEHHPRIAHLVAVHDMPSGSVGVSLHGRYERLLRDIDLLWRFTRIGFWKDMRERRISDASEFLALIMQKAAAEGAFSSRATRRVYQRLIQERQRELTKKESAR